MPTTDYYTSGVSPHTFTKAALFSSPTTGTFIIWTAPFNCVVKKVKAYQDTGSGSVVTAQHGTADLLVTDITIASASTWQDGGQVQNQAFNTGDTLAINVISVAGAPAYISIEITFTVP